MDYSVSEALASKLICDVFILRAHHIRDVIQAELGEDSSVHASSPYNLAMTISRLSNAPPPSFGLP